jgi:hypothetical protein
MSSRRYERMVIGLPGGAGSQPAVQAAADLAEFLNIELLGAFIADASLRALTGLPGRELRMFDLQWQPFDFQRISRDLDDAAEMARSRFAETAASRAIKTSFDVIAGPNMLGSLVRADDIIAIIEPGHPGERITQQFIDLLDAAFSTAAAVLVVPRRILRTSGAIMAVADSPGDASIPIALEIAAALKERLVIATGSATRMPPEILPAILADAKRLGIQVEQITTSRTAAGAAVPFLTGQSNERLRVISRNRRSENHHGLFSDLHGVPLLVVEFDRAELPIKPEGQKASLQARK